ncbi:MAG: DMT family transporter [Cryobacterium sp.]|nr:DMT family transporter [Oligoflexia bacterium]
MRESTLGSMLVALSAMLWATDALVRYPMVSHGIDPVITVFFDHAIGVALLTPYLLRKFGRATFQLTRPQWCGLFSIGAGASAVATVLFTTSFRYVNPSVSILLQKLQPVFVILLATTFLGERPRKSFFIWGPLALFAGLLISFPSLDFSFLGNGSLASRGSLFALGAAAIWALATVIGKVMLAEVPPLIVTYWRFVFGLLALGALVAFRGTSIGDSFAPLYEPKMLRSFLYVALVPGLLAMILYYQGMVRAPATTTTIMELLFPITAVLLNTVFLSTPLLPLQGAAALILLFAITQISLAPAGEMSHASEESKLPQV